MAFASGRGRAFAQPTGRTIWHNVRLVAHFARLCDPFASGRQRQWRVSSRMSDLGPQSSRYGQHAGRAPPGPQLDADARCVAAVVAGQRERFSELVERYQDAVLAVVRGYVRDPHAAEDVAQDVFLKSFSALGQLREPKLFFPWLLRIARHRISQTGQRREQRQNLRPLTGEEPVAAPVHAEEERIASMLRGSSNWPNLIARRSSSSTGAT